MFISFLSTLVDENVRIFCYNGLDGLISKLSLRKLKENLDELHSWKSQNIWYMTNFYRDDP